MEDFDSSNVGSSPAGGTLLILFQRGLAVSRLFHKQKIVSAILTVGTSMESCSRIGKAPLLKSGELTLVGVRVPHFPHMKNIFGQIPPCEPCFSDSGGDDIITTLDN